MSMSVDIPMYPHQCKKLAVSYCWEYFDNVASKLPARVGNSSVLFWKARIGGTGPLYLLSKTEILLLPTRAGKKGATLSKYSQQYETAGLLH